MSTLEDLVREVDALRLKVDRLQAGANLPVQPAIDPLRFPYVTDALFYAPMHAAGIPVDTAPAAGDQIGRAPTMTGGVIGQPGRYGRGLQFAEPTTNLVFNSSFAKDAPGTGTPSSWTQFNAPQAGSGVSTFSSRYGDKAYQLVANGTNQGIYQNIGISNATVYTVSMWIYVQGMSTSGLLNLFIDKGGMNYVLNPIPDAWVADGKWHRMTYTFTSMNTNMTIYLVQANVGSVSALFDGIQLEQKSHATPYCDGGLGQGHSFTGVADGSTSQRTAGYTSWLFPTVAYSGFTISFWLTDWIKTGTDGNSSYPVFVYVDGNFNFHFFHWNGAAQHYGVDLTLVGSRVGVAEITGAAADAVFDGGSHHIAVTFTPTSMTLYVDGTEVAAASFAAQWLPNLSHGTLYVGDSNGPGGGIVDELIVLDYPATPSQVMALYSQPIQLTRNIPLASMMDWSNVAPITGWSSFTTKVIEYCRIGNMVFVNFDLRGTSNSTTTSFSLPYPCIVTDGVDGGMARCQDNGGTIIVGVFGMPYGSGTVTFYRDAAGNTWTASGTKIIQGQFFYRTG